MRKSLLFAVLVCLTFSTLFMTSCVKEEPTEIPTEAAPKLPKAAMFILSFDDFEDADTNKSFGNWFHAATTVVAWNTVLTLQTVVPVAAFFESFNHSPEFEGDLTWRWTYSYPIANDTYNAELVGKILNPDEVEWKMYISKEGGYSNFLWYEGITRTDETNANWTLNHQPQNGEPFLSIEYQIENGEESIQYENIIPNHAGNGGFIKFWRDNTAELDANYEVYHKETDNFTKIKWDREMKHGQVKDENRFGDSEWHCWDKNLKNVDCE